MTTAWKACLAAIAILAACPAQAQNDISGHVDLYARVRVAGFALPVDIRQSGARTRVDVNTGGIVQTYIADREKGVLISLLTAGQTRTALVFPLDRADGIIPLPLELPVVTRQAAVKIVGASLVNGKPCRLMEFSGYLNQSGLLCATGDNIILQMTKQGRKDPLFQVMDLTIGAQDASWFRPPAGYTVTAVPAIGGASASNDGPTYTTPTAPPVAPKPRTTPTKP
ncbi:hypothetical protein AEAC466_07910 [Asticcacaulis sp. AC466]|uniref:hypothetical protein n=1 Tax=Asticcacaulis sp. AC466 TaxID=1282362 RepID=UPI0003C3E367|nr:hypothetical protein [Asticcacaulis sp. AC466]ESQ84276.1 hypothetical protein AEAC466_07910 [Asticcacaulis sp. AC466]